MQPNLLQTADQPPQPASLLFVVWTQAQRSYCKCLRFLILLLPFLQQQPEMLDLNNSV